MGWEPHYAPLLQLTLALGGGAIVLGAVLHWIKRIRPGIAGGDDLKIVQVLAVGPRERIILLESQNHRFLVGVTPSTVTPLWSLPSPAVDLSSRSEPSAAAADSSSPTFPEILAQRRLGTAASSEVQS
ncbi:MAG: flagellar biosynthetic protein FliO [Hydrogenophilus sp.]|nr:flagellar biosynthetic protein FliO [Hydrogenophilus sp.]